MNRIIFLFISVIVFNNVLLAGDTKSPTFKKIVKKANAYFEFGEYEQALPLYLKADSLQKGTAEIDYKIGICYVYSIHHERALPYLKKAYDEGYVVTDKPTMEKNDFFDAYESKSLYFNLGRAYHWNYRFDEAIQFYKKEYDLYEQHYLHSHQLEKELLKKFIREVENAQILIKDTVEFVVENMGPVINSEYEELAPQISEKEDVLIFTASRPTTTGGKKDGFGDYMEDVYVSYKDENGNWKTPVSIKSVNTDEHDAAIGLSPEGDKLLVYRNNHHLTGDIYISVTENGKWSNPEKMPEGINSKFLENSASMTRDGKRIYFTSNRPNGIGGEDIYMSELQLNGTWSEPKNLGYNINTPYDDDAPFIAADGKTLYFSSKGHNSMGGYDIFKAVYNEDRKEWSKPVNMGFPINTPEHDIFFVWSVDGKRAYFSSHREDSYGLDDIYMMTLPEKPTPIIQKVTLKGFVKTTKDNLVKSEIRLIDEKTNQVLMINDVNQDGSYIFDVQPNQSYKIQVSSSETLPYEQKITIKDVSVNHNVQLQIPEKGTQITLKNVNFDYNKATLREESFPELDKYVDILKKNETNEIEIAGHTDNVGSDEYNTELSLRRAQVVVDYLVSKGVNKKKIFAVGYGEQVPIDTNDTEEGRQENRRTELKIHGPEEGQEWKKQKQKEAKAMLK